MSVQRFYLNLNTTSLSNLSRETKDCSLGLVSVLVLTVGEVLYEAAEEAIGVSHGGQQDRRWNETLDDTSGDGARENSTGHDKAMGVVKAQDFRETFAEQDIRTIVQKGKPVGNRSDGGPEHVGC
jgi:hypothetical protein